MRDEGKLRRLRSLLERVERNARAPRVRPAHPAPAPAEPAVERGGGAPAPEARIATRAPSPAAPPVAERVQPAEELNRLSVEVFEGDVELLEEEEIVEIPSEPPTMERRVEPLAARAPEWAAPPKAEPAPAAGLGAVDIDFDDMEEAAPEEPPASSRRAKVAAESMDAALSGAAEQLDSEREVPIKTPPPESGPQEAVPPAQVLQAPAIPDIDDLLAEPAPAAVAGRSPSPAEVEISEPEPPPLSAERATAEAKLEPEIIRRPAAAAGATPVSFVQAAQAFQPQTFVELLDASLSLGR